MLYDRKKKKKDIQALEKNTLLQNKIRRVIDNSKEIQFQNEIFSITKLR